jgi:hypothetical protein
MPDRFSANRTNCPHERLRDFSLMVQESEMVASGTIRPDRPPDVRSIMIQQAGNQRQVHRQGLERRETGDKLQQKLTAPQKKRRPYSITSSAMASSWSGIFMPIALAVLRLAINSYFVGFCTGRSPGFAPFKMRSTYIAARRYWSLKLEP